MNNTKMSQNMKAVVFKGPHKVVIEDRMPYAPRISLLKLTNVAKVRFLRSRKMEISLSRWNTQLFAAGE